MLARAECLVQPAPNEQLRALGSEPKCKNPTQNSMNPYRSRTWNGVPPESMKMQPRILHLVQDDNTEVVKVRDILIRRADEIELTQIPKSVPPAIGVICR